MTGNLKQIVDALPLARRKRVQSRAAELIALEQARRSAAAAQAETTRKLKLGAKLPDADPLIASSGDLGSVK